MLMIDILKFNVKLFLFTLHIFLLLITGCLSEEWTGNERIAKNDEDNDSLNIKKNVELWWQFWSVFQGSVGLSTTVMIAFETQVTKDKCWVLFHMTLSIAKMNLLSDVWCPMRNDIGWILWCASYLSLEDVNDVGCLGDIIVVPLLCDDGWNVSWNHCRMMNPGTPCFAFFV